MSRISGKGGCRIKVSGGRGGGGGGGGTDYKKLHVIENTKWISKKSTKLNILRKILRSSEWEKNLT